jgi:hypothetical protein
MPIELRPAPAVTLLRLRWKRKGSLVLASTLGLMACASPPAPQPDPPPVTLPANAPAAVPETPPAPLVVELPPVVTPVTESSPVPPPQPNPWLAASGTNLPTLLDHAERLRSFLDNEPGNQ